MEMPSVIQYVETLESADGLFRTLTDFEVERDVYDQVRVRAGNSAAIFKISFRGEMCAMKCFIKNTPWLRDRYEYMAIQSGECDYVPRVTILKEEMYVFDHSGNGRYYDVVLSPWVHGETMYESIRSALVRKDQEFIRELSAKFDRLAVDLLQKPWAHGDLKPENIVVRPDGSLSLIDFDAAYVPSLHGKTTTEIGTFPYQHRLRDVDMYEKGIDDYSIAFISSVLHVLARDVGFFDQYIAPNKSVVDVFTIAAGESRIFDEMLTLWNSKKDLNYLEINKMMASPSPCLPNLSALLSEIVYNN